MAKEMSVRVVRIKCTRASNKAVIMESSPRWMALHRPTLLLPPMVLPHRRCSDDAIGHRQALFVGAARQAASHYARSTDAALALIINVERKQP